MTSHLTHFPNQQAIIIANVVNHFNYFIYLNWLPAFFHNAMGLNVRSSALFTFLPWVAMARSHTSAAAIASLAMATLRCVSSPVMLGISDPPLCL